MNEPRPTSAHRGDPDQAAAQYGRPGGPGQQASGPASTPETVQPPSVYPAQQPTRSSEATPDRPAFPPANEPAGTGTAGVGTSFIPAAPPTHTDPPPPSAAEPEGSSPGSSSGAAAATPPEAPVAPAPAAAPTEGNAEIVADLAALRAQVGALSAQIGSVTAQLEPIEFISRGVREMSRLRERDLSLVEKLHTDNAALRQGEIASAMGPLLAGLVRLHDQMGQLAGGDQQSDAGMLRTLLLQLLDTAGGVTSYEPRPGETFDSAKHSGAGRSTTTDKDADGTIARTIRPGFTRADGTTVRVAEVEVYRYQEPAPTPPAPEPVLATVPVPENSAPPPVAQDPVPAPEPQEASAPAAVDDRVVETPQDVTAGTEPGTETGATTTPTPNEAAAPTGQQEER